MVTRGVTSSIRSIKGHLTKVAIDEPTSQRKSMVDDRSRSYFALRYLLTIENYRYFMTFIFFFFFFFLFCFV